jgi:hypothetical protein
LNYRTGRFLVFPGPGPAYLHPPSEPQKNPPDAAIRANILAVVDKNKDYKRDQLSIEKDSPQMAGGLHSADPATNQRLLYSLLVTINKDK